MIYIRDQYPGMSENICILMRFEWPAENKRLKIKEISVKRGGV